MKSNRFLFASILMMIFIFNACQSNDTFYAKVKSYDNGWPTEQPAEFEVEVSDTVNHYDLFFNIRNNQDYKFSNLFVIADINFPNGKVIVDTLEYEMAYPNGEFMGEGFSSIKSSKLWYKQNVKFTEIGEYKINIKQAMRAFGEVEGLENLKGITDVGLSIEKHKQENDR